MTLRFKTLLMIGLTLTGLILVLYITASTVLLESFALLEERATRRDVERTLNALSESISTLDRTNRDYASWDDSYQFIQDGDPEYVDYNLIDSVYIEFQLNAILFVDIAGDVIYSEGFDLQEETRQPASPSLQALILPDSPLLQHDNTEGYQGIILLDEGPMVISLRPILPSIDDGPVLGTLIMGRYLNEDELERLSQLTDLNLKLHPFEDENPELAGINHLLSAADPLLVKPIDEEWIAGYGLIDDIYGNPALLLEVNGRRDIYQQGQLSIRYLILSLLVVGLVSGALTLLLIERLVLARLTRLSAGVGDITLSGDLAGRVEEHGRDELSQLSNGINRMLEALDKAQAQQKQTEQALRQAKETAEAANLAKSEFVSMVSHELKIPMTYIKGYADLMANGNLGEVNETQASFLRNIGSSVDRMTRLVSDLADISNLEAGGLRLDCGPVNLRQVIEEVVESLRSQLDGRTQTLTVTIPDDLPLVWGDYTRLVQILANLVNNSHKYTPEGGQVMVRADWMVDGNKKGQGRKVVHVAVQDTGIGISQEEQEKLFQKFFRSEDDQARQAPGTGLGLSITKTLVEMQGGRIWFESEFRRGTTFHFMIPVAE